MHGTRQLERKATAWTSISHLRNGSLMAAPAALAVWAAKIAVACLIVKAIIL